MKRLFFRSFSLSLLFHRKECVMTDTTVDSVIQCCGIDTVTFCSWFFFSYNWNHSSYGHPNCCCFWRWCSLLPTETLNDVKWCYKHFINYIQKPHWVNNFVIAHKVTQSIIWCNMYHHTHTHPHFQLCTITFIRTCYRMRLWCESLLSTFVFPHIFSFIFEAR